MNKSEYDAILQNAIQSEIDSQNFYRSVADKMSDAHLKSMFGNFVQEEKKHQDILEGFREAVPASLPFKEDRDYKVAETAEAPKPSTEMKPADAFKLAMKKEEEAMDHYLDLADGCTDPEQERIFRDLAAMEREHKLKMENAFVDVGYPEVW
jgi:rubrerythrin